MEKHRIENQLSIKKLVPSISDGADRVANYVQTVKSVRIDNSNNEVVAVLSIDTTVFWDLSKEQLISSLNSELEEASLARTAIINSLLTSLEAE